MRYDDVEPDEAIDLVRTLPPGSLYVAKKRPDLAWSEARELAADIRDDIIAAAYALRGVDGAPRVVRPSDIVARRAASSRAREVRKKIEASAWEQVEGE